MTHENKEAWHKRTIAVQAMRDAGLADGYAACLGNGLWPSLDVLPEAEKQTAGKLLNPGAHVINTPG